MPTSDVTTTIRSSLWCTPGTSRAFWMRPPSSAHYPARSSGSSELRWIVCNPHGTSAPAWSRFLRAPNSRRPYRKRPRWNCRRRGLEGRNGPTKQSHLPQLPFNFKNLYARVQPLVSFSAFPGKGILGSLAINQRGVESRSRRRLRGSSAAQRVRAAKFDESIEKTLCLRRLDPNLRLPP